MVLAIAAISQPFIIFMLTVAHRDRKELLTQVNKINGRIGVLEDWRNWHDKVADDRFLQIRSDIKDLQTNKHAR